MGNCPQEMEPPTDRELVQRVAEGDTEAFGRVVERYSEPLYNLALRIVRDPARAEDVVQETFIRAYERIDGFRGAGSLSTWLYRIACNRAIDDCRRRRWVRLDDRMQRLAAEADEPRYDDEAVAQMHRALERLAPEERALVALFYEEERSVAEIAQITGLTENNVKVKLHRVRQRIRRYMEG